MSSVWEQIDNWPAGADGEVDHGGVALFCEARIKELTPAVQAASDLIRSDYDNLSTVVAQIAEGVGNDHPSVILMRFALGVVDMADAQYGMNAALVEIARRAGAAATSHWGPQQGGQE